MATNFPASLDTLTNPTPTTSMSGSLSHAGQHSDLNDAVEALEAKVGADSSAVSSSHDYKIAQLEARTSGKILQVVSTTKTDTFTASVAAGGDVAVTGLSLNITPSSTSSKILLVANLTGAFQYERFGFSFDRGGTRLSQGDTDGSRTVATAAGSHDTAAVTVANVSGLYLDSPSSTSSLTYSIYLHCFATATSSVYLNRTITDTDSASFLRATSSITALEVAA